MLSRLLICRFFSPARRGLYDPFLVVYLTCKNSVALNEFGERTGERILKKAVIFDMDGVISDTEWIYVDKVLEVLREEGINVTGDDIHDVFGTNMLLIFIQLKERFGLEGEPEDYKNRVHFLRDEHVRTHGIQPMEGAVELIGKLKAAGIPIAVASSANRKIIERTLGAFSVLEMIDAVASGAELKRGKPAPDVYLEAARLLGVSPSDCMVIEDTAPGVEGAKSAGMECIAFQPEKAVKMDLSKADRIMTSFVGRNVEDIVGK